MTASAVKMKFQKQNSCSLHIFMYCFTLEPILPNTNFSAKSFLNFPSLPQCWQSSNWTLIRKDLFTWHVCGKKLLLEFFMPSLTMLTELKFQIRKDLFIRHLHVARSHFLNFPSLTLCWKSWNFTIIRKDLFIWHLHVARSCFLNFPSLPQRCWQSWNFTWIRKHLFIWHLHVARNHFLHFPSFPRHWHRLLFDTCVYTSHRNPNTIHT